jgi:hypothetical protein
MDQFSNLNAQYILIVIVSGSSQNQSSQTVEAASLGRFLCRKLPLEAVRDDRRSRESSRTLLSSIISPAGLVSIASGISLIRSMSLFIGSVFRCYAISSDEVLLLIYGQWQSRRGDFLSGGFLGGAGLVEA